MSFAQQIMIQRLWFWIRNYDNYDDMTDFAASGMKNYCEGNANAIFDCMELLGWTI